MRVAAIAMLGLCLAGCGGSGGSSTASNLVAQTFVGNFVGVWKSPGGVSEDAAITVAKSGAVTGTVSDTSAADAGTIAGTMNIDGDIYGTVTYPGGLATFTGKYIEQYPGFSGTASETYLTKPYSITFILSPQ